MNEPTTQHEPRPCLLCCIEQRELPTIRPAMFGAVRAASERGALVIVYDEGKEPAQWLNAPVCEEHFAQLLEHVRRLNSGLPRR